jgi:flagellar hook-associated protein 1 FlgK
MTDLLTLGAAGLRAYSQAMGTIGDNIANAQTLGYVRRTTNIGETVPAGSGSPLLRTEALSGYRTISIDRAINQWLVDDSRNASADAGMASARLNWVEATENAMAQSGNDVGSALGHMFNHADALTADPASTALRNQFLGSVSQVAGAFQRTANALNDTANSVANTTSVAVGQLNANLKALQQINISLLRATDGTANQAGLLDERDRLLDAITGDLPVSIDYGNRGQAVVRFENATGPILVDGSSLASIGVSAAADGRLGFTLSTTGTAIVPSSGQLAGLSIAANHIADQRAALDTLAAQVANDLNTAHAAGMDANGNPGAALFVLSSGGAAGLSAASLSPSSVAAADASGPSGNLVALSGLRGATGIEASWANQVALQSQFVAAARAEDAAAGARRDAAYTARSVASAVDLDNEAAELLRFQQAYQASARVIQVARENIQAILNAF